MTKILLLLYVLQGQKVADQLNTLYVTKIYLSNIFGYAWFINYL